MYTIKKVSNLTGISAVTIRAWERRYGLGPSERTEGGHRLYSEKDVQDLKWLRKQTEEEGVYISQAVQLLLKKKQQEEKTETLSIKEMKESNASLVQQLFQSLKALESEHASQAWDLCLAVWSFETVFQQIVPQILNRIGDEYRDGEASIFQVQFASHWLMHRITPVLRVFPLDRSLPRAIALCPSGEHHQIGLLLFTLFLRGKGMDVAYLGADIPLDGIDDFITQFNIGVVCISITSQKLQSSVEEKILSLLTNYPALKIVAGGPGMKGATENLSKWRIGNSAEDWNEWFSIEWTK